MHIKDYLTHQKNKSKRQANAEPETTEDHEEKRQQNPLTYMKNTKKRLEAK
jgi:hypothetical protein